MKALWFLVSSLSLTACLETNVPEEYLKTPDDTPQDETSGPDQADDSLEPIEGKWTDVTNELRRSRCSGLSLLAHSPHENRLFAGVSEFGYALWESTDGGGSWQELGQAAASESIDARLEGLNFDPKDPDVFWASGIYGSRGIFKTEDGGRTFVHLGEQRHNDFVAVDFTDKARNTLLTGGHEAARTVRRSRDGGENWDEIGDALPDGSGDSSIPFILDSDTFLMGLREFGGFGAIVRSTNGGKTWKQVWSGGVEMKPVRTDDGVLYWATAGEGPPTRSTDDGKSWVETAPIYADKFFPIAPAVLSGRIVAAATEKGIVASADRGESWTYVAPSLEVRPEELVYSSYAKAFFVAYPDCGGSGRNHIVRYDVDADLLP